MRNLCFFFPLPCIFLLFPPLTLSNQISGVNPQLKNISTDTVPDRRNPTMNKNDRNNSSKSIQEKGRSIQSKMGCSLKTSGLNRQPLVLVADSSHLWVSWAWSWFKACSNPNSLITVSEEREQAVVHSDGRFGYTIIEADPCLKHSLKVKVFNKSAETQTKVYNGKIDKSLYSGMLGQTVSGACLKDELTLSLPDPPDAVRSCIKTRGDQKLDTGKSGETEIRLEIVNPDQKQNGSTTACIKVTVSGITSCEGKENQVATITNVTSVHLDECQNENGVNLTAAVVIPLLLVALVVIAGVLAFLGRKRLHRFRIPVREWFCSREKCESRFARACCLCSCCQLPTKMGEDDCNPTYGDYEYEDGTLRKNTMEMIDHNEDYDQTMVRKRHYNTLYLLLLGKHCICHRRMQFAWIRCKKTGMCDRRG